MQLETQAAGPPFTSRLLPGEVQRRLAYYPRVLDIALYVRNNLSQPIRLEDVAERAGMTPCSFSRYFTEKVGITFSTLLKVLRIEHALAELECRDSAISDLAEQTGYQSCCTFSRAFKEIMGRTPSEYRRRVLYGAPAEGQAAQPQPVPLSRAAQTFDALLERFDAGREGDLRK